MFFQRFAWPGLGRDPIFLDGGEAAHLITGGEICIICLCVVPCCGWNNILAFVYDTFPRLQGFQSSRFDPVEVELHYPGDGRQVILWNQGQ